MNRIQELFDRKKSDILSVFFTAGFPSRNDTPVIAASLESAGADLIEIGIPFSDPVADGPVIQASNKVALDNGMTVELLLQQLMEIRKSVKLPIILMGYVNPVLQYGFERFCADAARAGADGLILPDLPLDVYEDQFRDATEKAGLLNIFLISPTTSAERIARIDAAGSGFIYAVSASSTTGARKGFGQDQLDYFARLRDLRLKNPLIIGFGISDHETFSAACRYSAGAIVGSAFITMLGKSSDIPQDVSAFVRGLRNA